MIIKSLELKNFRNYKYLSLDFADQINILYGENAQGKTNVLEALYVSATSKSHKAGRDKEMIYFEEEEGHICTIVEKEGIEERIDIHLKKNHKKGIAINQMPVARASDLLGILRIVLFSPEDLNMIKEGPIQRRRFLDMELCQIDSLYLSDLANYNRALTQRNKLLKDLSDRPEWYSTLDVWDNQLIQFGKKIICRRKQFIEELNPLVKKIHQDLTGGKEELVLKYEPDTKEEELEEKIKSTIEKDRKLFTTGCGPHRDDMLFEINGIDIRKYGSQGQQRCSALSLKLAEIQLVKEQIGEPPVLLLDDVLSELDSGRQKYLLESIKDTQTVITCTGLDEFVKNRFHIDKVMYVSEGTIQDEEEINGSRV